MRADQRLIFDTELIKKYDQTGPRYTSYPTAVQFKEDFGESRYRQIAQKTNPDANPLSLYFHIPFCDTLCFYCACNKIATKDRTLAITYLEYLYREIEMQGQLFENSRIVDQLHWGGGTPTFLSLDQMHELMAKTSEHFQLRSDDTGEYSIEIDPREIDADGVKALRQIGFNRMSIGVQDYDDDVQKAVNRIQSREHTEHVFQAARENGFRSISVDLIYGLPRQKLESFRQTLLGVLDTEPDRLSIFNYAHMPKLFKPQRRINEEELPTAIEKLDMLQMISEIMDSAGYVFIGMDHFAKPDDELAIAQQNDTLYRNFQGYSTHRHCDLIGLGVTSISMVGSSYSQNARDIEYYYREIDAGTIPVHRGLELSRDDEIRRDLITRLICHFHLNTETFSEQWQIDFNSYFTEELQRLAQMESDDLLIIEKEDIKIKPKGRFLIRTICMVFDYYLMHKTDQQFSKVI